jgi:hypothetical protein
MCTVRLYTIVPHYLITGTIFRIKLLNTKRVFWFSLQLLSQTFLILRRTERYMIWNMWSTRYSCHISIQLEFSWQVFEKYYNIEFHENPSSGSWVCSTRTDGQTDRHNEANSRFSQCCERAKNFPCYILVPKADLCHDRPTDKYPSHACIACHVSKTL